MLKDVQISEGAFVIDGEKHFLFSAEIHYFRIPFHQWEDRLRKIKYAGFDTVSFYVPWFWHEFKDGVFDFHGESSLERDLVSFLELANALSFNIIFKPGPYVMSELKNEGLPNWLYEKIPHAIAKTVEGNVHPTRVFSYLHNDYLYYVKRWYYKALEIAKKYNVILIQIDNEVGMFQWITGHGDYNEDTVKKFEGYLSDFSEKELISELKEWRYGKRFSKSLLRRYHEFSRYYYAKYLDVLKSYVHEVGLNVPVVVNIHGFDMVDYAKRGKNFPVGVSQLMNVQKLNKDKAAVLSGDYYIGNIVHENFSDIAIANAVMYAIQDKDQPLFSIEFQSGFQMDKPKLQPSTLELTSLQCIGQGMNGINYYMFVGGQNPENCGLMGSYHDWQAPISMNGELRRGYFVLKNVVEKVRKMERNLLDSKPVFDTFFGFIPSYYSTEFLREHSFDDEDIRFKREKSIFDGIIRGLKLLNYNFSGLNLEDDNICVKDYPSLWVFSCISMPLKVQERLVRYVDDGGKLILFPEVPIFDEFDKPCDCLQKYLGIECVKKERWKFADVFGVEINAYHVDKYTLKSTSAGCKNAEFEAFGLTYDKNLCAFKKKISKGDVFVLGCGIEMEREYKLNVIKEICKLMGIQKKLSLKSKDGFVDGYLRESKKKLFAFLNNYDDYEKTVEVFINGKSFGTVNLSGRSGMILENDKVSDESQQDLNI